MASTMITLDHTRDTQLCSTIDLLFLSVGCLNRTFGTRVFFCYRNYYQAGFRRVPGCLQTKFFAYPSHGNTSSGLKTRKYYFVVNFKYQMGRLLVLVPDLCFFYHTKGGSTSNMFKQTKITTETYPQGDMGGILFLLLVRLAPDTGPDI